MQCLELFTKSSKWTQGAAARNAAGDKLHCDLVGSPEAVCWDLLGAIVLCYGDRWKKIEERVCNRLFGAIDPSKGKGRRMGDCLSIWNDRHTFEDVQKLCMRMKI